MQFDIISIMRQACIGKKMHYKHIDGITVTAQFAKENGLRYRYRLEIKTTSHTSVAGKTACVVMQNPSYAGEDEADKSVQFMEKVVFQKRLSEFLCTMFAQANERQTTV